MDIKLNFEEKGRGIPLILLHGNGEDMTYFENQFDFLSTSFHVYAVDTRGHGRSDRGVKPFTLDQFADDLFGFIKDKRIKKPILFGFSDGANIAIIFSIKHPDSIRGLVLNSGNLFPEGLRDDVIDGIREEYEEAIESHDTYKEELFSLMAYQPNIDPERLKDISVPTLVIVGRDDVVKREHSILISSSFPLGEFVEVEGDHFAAYENPEEFNMRLSEFLSDHFLPHTL